MAASTGEDTSSTMNWDLTIQLINREFGDDISTLGRAQELLQQVSATEASLEQQVKSQSDTVIMIVSLVIRLVIQDQVMPLFISINLSLVRLFSSCPACRTCRNCKLHG